MFSFRVKAMAMALPVIVTNYSGPTEYATDDSAYLIPLHDPPHHLDELSFGRWAFVCLSSTKFLRCDTCSQA